MQAANLIEKEDQFSHVEMIVSFKLHCQWHHGDLNLQSPDNEATSVESLLNKTPNL